MRFLLVQLTVDGTVQGNPGSQSQFCHYCLQAAFRLVCQHLQWPLIDKDDARDCLQTLPAAVHPILDANQLSYDIMFSYCRTQLSLGLNVVLDCPFARVHLYDAAVAIAQQVRSCRTTCQ